MKTTPNSSHPSPRAPAPSKYRAPMLACLVGAGAITSCAEYPIAVAVQGEHGTYSYSAKQGLVITVQK